MTTTDLLRETLAHDAESAALPERVAVLRARLLDDPAARGDDPLLVIAADGSRRGRRLRPLTVGLAGVAAAAVAALVVTLFVANRPGAGSAPAATVSAAALPIDTYGFQVDPDPIGLTFTYQGAVAGVQGGSWGRPGMNASTATATVAVVDVLTGTGEDPVPIRPTDATVVQVGGTEGWSAPWRPGLADLHFGMDPADTLTVWRDDTSGLWVALVTVGVGAVRIAELAETVQVAEYHPVRVPVRLAWLPPGLSVTGVFTNAGFVDLAFGAEGTGFNLGIGPVGTVGGGQPRSAPPHALAVGAFRGVYRADDPVTVVSNGVVDVSVTSDAGQASVISGAGSPAAMPLETVTRLLEGLTVADLDDPASWTDLSAALPAS